MNGCNNKKSGESKCVGTEECWIDRPKYFKGQLLTDADLTSGQKYVIEKNKLHNRYLHGWGVVCGLKVKCFPCCTGHGASGKVLIEPGYAIDCCGNDIVVCNEVEYDVVKRINELKTKEKAEADPCSGEKVEEETTCESNVGGDKYYLILKYKEVSSKPATALNTQNGCSIQSCVPSRIEECYELDLVEYCTLNQTIEERFLTKAKKCVELFSNTWQKVFNDKDTDVKKQGITEDQLKTFIREYHKVLPSHFNCDILDELDAIDFSGGEGEKDPQGGLVQLYIMIFGLLLECICQALLRPCPECNEDDLVILAAITVKGKKIDSICNFERKVVMTFPTLFYYLPLDTVFKQITKYLCCDFVDFLANTFQGVQLPAWQYVAVASKSNFAAPKMMSANFTRAFKAVPQTMFRVFDPSNISLESSLKKDASLAESDLKKLNIKVLKTERYKPSLADFNLEKIISSVPVARPGSKVISFVDDSNKVVGFRVVEEEKELTPEGKEAEVVEVTGLKKELEDLKASVAVMKSHMKKDTKAVIATMVPVEKSYRSLATELTENLTKEIPLEALKDVGEVKGKEMRKANLRTVHDVLEAVPVVVSDAVKEPMVNAVKYVDNAEELTVDAAKLIAVEMKTKDIKKKADLVKLDTKKIADTLKISEALVKRSIEKIE